ncbi:putative manganese-dependent inorganic diphosphatase [Caldicellulosiruptor naganoensis]|uniref:inorganic diphosphatase n=1 Tax=Caldicellulosiruptor naganoensis TaxID=29324 RepID=A0ABY7BJR6_9FIRM|nr:putative manganese-dependent inorganic diphosphatase [Caldicellulosiruptor naganoensis]WAM31821.1 putative manganese-dependent inorganic diphosphatase [Caldicellulosiruptor naganoensis]
MSIVYIFGHKNPDTDSICSAIAYANLKRTLEGLDAIPVRIGQINRETQFVLNYFSVEEPEYIDNVYTQIRDIKYDKPLTISEDSSIYDAWKLLVERNFQTALIVDKSNTLRGIASLGDIAKSYLFSLEELSKYDIPISNIVRTLKGKVVLQNADFAKGNIVVAAMSLESFLKRVSKDCTLIVGNRENVQIEAIKKGAKTLIITGNHDVSEEVIDVAKKHNCTIIVVPYDTFDTARLISQCLPISYIMKKKDIIFFKEIDYINEIKDTMLKYKYRNFPIVDDNKKVLGLLARRHILNYEGKKVILVDHNELSQSVEGIEEAKILEIIDHHRVGGIATASPILFRNHPVGSTSTIINKIFEENGLAPEPKIAGIMCAAILSDTLMFRSPTCTSEDIRAARKLAQIAGIDIDDFGIKMFKAGTSLEDKTIEEIFYTDFKDFIINNLKIGVGQVNTLADTKELDAKLLQFMEEVLNSKNYDMILLMITDIINEGSKILFVGKHKDILEKAFNIEIKGNSFYLPKVVSRKKQIIPPITKIINSYNSLYES